MEDYFEIIKNSYIGYWNYLKNEMCMHSSGQPWYKNYFYALILLSLLTWVIEILFPWRKNQNIFRKDFFLDAFYMFFNFFLFSLIAYNALSNVFVELFNNGLAIFGITNLVALELSQLPWWSQFLIQFILADFIQWNVHRMLHRFPVLWEFHKVHHSVEQMGFAAHLRFHFMETIIYKSIQYLPLAMLGFGIKDFFIVHMIALLIGHINHANLKISYGPLKYILNNPVMHIWHHAKILPAGTYGVNYGISLSIWDYLFKTAYIPSDGRDIALGFEDSENYPSGFISQIVKPFKQGDHV
ncbi:MAG: sterol desaturase family protein [Saprospiraceae bacterium]|nr:sterol desaturase family protein [Candidatus Vicinibacter affinis]MBP6172633.1 sterol desaturase family protein [Saprospiraceae bacterium]MBK6571069.1 sterol desaturase family protein [Candidatus Vicinibacter affinis]MBK7304805.1 sterol desaturase family protein [Candidatus Vicinibacter affinis]MBK7694569.1 sterol desaturase family protein [Candidatus Vicinibacter affinis]